MRKLGEIIRPVVDDAGRRSVAYHLGRASGADDQAAIQAFREADSIRRRIDLSWDDLIAGERRAA